MTELGADFLHQAVVARQGQSIKSAHPVATVYKSEVHAFCI
jgi:hypothetical protein